MVFLYILHIIYILRRVQAMQAISKSTLKQYKQILNLPYTSLLQQIISTTKNKAQFKPIHEQYDILALSAKHQCPYLFQLSLNQHINTNTNTNINANINTNSKDNFNFKTQWSNITKAGLRCLFQGGKQDRVDGMASVGKYFQRVRHQFVQPNEEEQPNTNYTQLMTYWMPTIFDVSGSSFKEIQAFKQDYVVTLDFICKMFDTELSSIGVIDYTKLFPAQIFNSSDQPLIKNVYMKHIYPNLCSQFNHVDKNGAIAWLSRLGLPSDQYIIRSLTHDLSRLNSKDTISEQQATIKQLEIANGLFIILRKMSFSTPNSTISNLIQNIWHKLSFDVVLRNIQVQSNDQLTSIFIGHLQKLVKTSQDWSIKQHQKISNIFLKLSPHNPIPSSSEVTPKILLLHEYRIIRYLLLSIHINLHSNTTQQTANQNHNQKRHQQKYLVLFKNLFNSQYVFKLIQKYIYVGDLLPELFYANEIYRLIAGQSIFSQGSQLKMLLDNVRNQYKQVIDMINNRPKFCEEQGVSWSRYDNIQNILSGCSRLTYYIQNPNLKATTKTQTIVKSLLNDIQFCCRFMYPTTSKLIRDNIEADLRLKITEQNNYPFFSEMEVHDMANTNRRQIYIKKNLGRLMRKNISKNSLLLDATNMGELEKKIGKNKLRNWL